MTATLPPSTPITSGTARTRGAQFGVRDCRHRFGGGVINDGGAHRQGASGMAGELVICRYQWPDAEGDQPGPSCNCGQLADAESIASADRDHPATCCRTG